MSAADVDVTVVGAGPCGLATAITLQQAGYSTLVLDAACVCSSITQYPTYATFFSTAEKLSLGGLPFLIADAKPTRRDALVYYRGVVRHFGVNVRQYERVERIVPQAGQRGFAVESVRRSGERHRTSAHAVVVATGYWGSPNRLNVVGEDLPQVSHVFREGHAAFMQRAVIVGGGNSAAEAALELWRCGAQVTLVHFGPTFDKKIKPWILSDLNNRIAEGSIVVKWNARVQSIEPDDVVIRDDAGEGRIPSDHVFLLTGFSPNVDLLREAGVPIDAVTGIPAHDLATLETTVPGLFIAGVVAAGFDANKVFIENGRYHGEKIVARLKGLPSPETPGVSRDLDGG